MGYKKNDVTDTYILNSVEKIGKNIAKLKVSYDENSIYNFIWESQYDELWFYFTDRNGYIEIRTFDSPWTVFYPGIIIGGVQFNYVTPAITNSGNIFFYVGYELFK